MRPFLVLALVCCPALAAGQQQMLCAPHDELTALLKERWGETRRGIGLTGTGMVMELYASEDTGSWSLLTTLPGGLTCLAASGQAWEEVRETEGEGA